MPEIGEIKRGREIGRVPYTKKYIWHPCPKCGKQRWVHCKKDAPAYDFCHPCAIKYGKHLRGAECSWWKGGRKFSLGYTLIKLLPDSPYYSMGHSRHYVFEHRLVMAQYLKRPLDKSEYVHHINGDKADNRISNLKLVSRFDHAIHTELCQKCEIRREIRLLRWEIKELKVALQMKLLEDSLRITK